MKTKENKELLAAGAVLIICLIILVFSSSIQGGERSIRVKPEITLPEYRTDAARAIDAYERIMERFIGLAERNFDDINTDVKDIAKKLVLMDFKLTELSTRMARIEKALGIEQAENTFRDKSDLSDAPKPLKKNKP